MNMKLYRSRTDKWLGGVCGGLGQSLGIDSAFVRLFFVLLGLTGHGLGMLIYLALWIVLPLEGEERGWRPTFGEGATFDENIESGAQQVAERARAMGDDLRQAVRRPHPQAGLIAGGALIFLGLVYLLRSLDLPWLFWLDFDYLWPLLLIVGGIILVLRNLRGE